MRIIVLLSILFSCLFLNSSISRADTFYITFKNTGNEDISYTMATRRLAMFGWRDWEAKGWIKLKAGEFHQAFYGVNEQVVFAFKKRGGYVVYSMKGGGGSKWLDGWHVAPKKKFRYSFRRKSSRSSKLTDYIKSSFGYRYEPMGFGTNHMVREHVNIPSYKSDKVIPFKSTQEATVEAKKGPVFPPNALQRLDSLLREHLSGSVCDGGFFVMKHPRGAVRVTKNGEIQIKGRQFYSTKKNKITSTGDLHSVRLEEIVSVDFGRQNECYRIDIRCEKRSDCAKSFYTTEKRSYKLRQSSFYLYFNSPETANEVGAELASLLGKKVMGSKPFAIEEKAAPAEAEKPEKPRKTLARDYGPYWLIPLAGVAFIVFSGVQSLRQGGVRKGVRTVSFFDGSSWPSHAAFLLATIVGYAVYLLSAILLSLFFDVEGADIFAAPASEILEAVAILSIAFVLLVASGYFLIATDLRNKHKSKKRIFFVSLVVYAVLAFMIAGLMPYDRFWGLGLFFVAALTILSASPFAVTWIRRRRHG